MKPHHAAWENAPWGPTVALNFYAVLPTITFQFLNAFCYPHGTDYYVDQKVPDHRIFGTFLLSRFPLPSLPNHGIILKVIINLLSI